LIDDICATTFLLKLLFLGEEEEDVAPVEPLEALVALLPLLIIVVVVAEKRFSLLLCCLLLRRSKSSKEKELFVGAEEPSHEEKEGRIFEGFEQKKRLFKKY